MKETIRTPRGEVLGIGKFVVSKKPDFGFTIPLLSFIVIRGEERYISTCIHVQTDGYGKTKEDAIIDMVENVSDFLYDNFTDPRCRDNGWKRFEVLLYESTHHGIELWDAYHKAQVRLAMQGRTLDKLAPPIRHKYISL